LFDALKSYIINLQMLYIDRLSIFDYPNASNENNNKTLSEMRKSLDQQNKTLVETNKKLSEIRQSLSQGYNLIGKNITTPLEFTPRSKQFYNNL